MNFGAGKRLVSPLGLSAWSPRIGHTSQTEKELKYERPGRVDFQKRAHNTQNVWRAVCPLPSEKRTLSASEGSWTMEGGRYTNFKGFADFALKAKAGISP